MLVFSPSELSVASAAITTGPEYVWVPTVVMFPPIEMSPAVVMLRLLRLVELPIAVAKVTGPLVELIVKD